MVSALTYMSAAFLVLMPLTVSAKTSTKTFTEKFDTVKHRDTKATTAKWDTKNSVGSLPKSTKPTIVNATNGLPAFDVFAIGAQGDDWMVGGSKNGGSVTKLYLAHDGKFADLSSLMVGFSGSVSAIASNSQYWLIGGSSELFKYDGVSMTDLSSDFATHFAAGFVYDIEWNGSYWLITGGDGGITKFDGTNFTMLTYDFNFVGAKVYCAWNGESWLLVGNNGRIFSYDEVTVTQLTSPFESENIYSLGSDGENWLIGGWVNGKPSLYQYDGTSFSDWTSKLTNTGDGIVSNIGWSHDEWLIVINRGGGKNDKIVTMSQDGDIISTQEDFDNAGQYVFSYNQFAQTSVMWLMTGGIVHNGTTSFVLVGPGAFKTNKRLQSKKLNATTKGTITEVTLTDESDIPDGSSVTYSVSNDLGLHWKRATSGKLIKFTRRGSSLLWRADLKSKNLQVTPTVQELQLQYKIRT